MLNTWSLPLVVGALLASAGATPTPGRAIGGAASLPQDKFALVVDFGKSASRPTPGYGISIQYGLTHQLDADVGAGAMPGSSGHLRAGVSYQAFRTADLRHALAIKSSAALVWFDTSTERTQLVSLSPGLAYELRVGEAPALGLYLDVGTSHFRMDVEKRGLVFFALTPDPPAEGRTDTHALRGALGAQTYLNPDASVGFELGPAYFLPSDHFILEGRLFIALLL